VLAILRRRLHEQVLAADDALLLPLPASPGPAAPRAPAQLPADVDAFVGRSAELAELSQLMICSATALENKARASTGGTQAAAVIISVVSGTAGVGKTALALLERITA
jgi:hypothetical protein